MNGMMMDTTMLYKSERFIITGNMFTRIVITDCYEDKSYVYMLQPLKLFRDRFTHQLQGAEDLFILNSLKQISKEAA